MTRPERLPQRINADRVTNVTRHMSPGSDDGNTALSRPVVRNQNQPQRAGTIVVVEHGDDGTLGRPVGATLVMWVGAATPANGADYDFWYPATI